MRTTASSATPRPRRLPLLRSCGGEGAAAIDCPGWCAAARPPPANERQGLQRSHAALRAGELLDGGWRLVRRLGEGATAEVWLARDPSSPREVAIKMMRPELIRDADMLGRFAMEGRALARVHHPNVVRMLARGTFRDRPFIVMEHVVGIELSALLAALGSRRMPVGRALGILRGVLDGLAAMHAANVLHGDVKPSNVLVGPSRVTLVDLGLAHPLAAACQSRKDVVYGTPRYLAPELAAGIADGPSAVTDVYAAATLAFELLTGRAPFASAGIQEMLRAQIENCIPAPSTLRRELPGAIDEAILRALCKAPSQRTRSAELLQAELMWAAGRSRAVSSVFA